MGLGIWVPTHPCEGPRLGVRPSKFSQIEGQQVRAPSRRARRSGFFFLGGPSCRQVQKACAAAKPAPTDPQCRPTGPLGDFFLHRHVNLRSDVTFFIRGSVVR